MRIILQKLLSITAFALAVFFIQSCSRNTTNPVDQTTTPKAGFDPITIQSTTSDVDGVFYTEAATVGTSQPTYSIGGYIYESRTNDMNKIFGGSLVASSKAVDPALYPTYGYQWVPGLGGDYIPPVFGQLATWSLSGYLPNNIPAFSTTLTAPQIINMGLPQTFEVSKSAGVQINWTADNTNANGIWLVVDYLPGASIKEKSSLPNTTMYFYKNTPDDGTEMLSSQDLAQFPEESIINIAVMRITNKTVSESGKNFILASIARSKSEHKLMP